MNGHDDGHVAHSTTADGAHVAIGDRDRFIRSYPEFADVDIAEATYPDPGHATIPGDVLARMPPCDCDWHSVNAVGHVVRDDQPCMVYECSNGHRFALRYT